MNKELLKHIEILKTVTEIKESIENKITGLVKMKDGRIGNIIYLENEGAYGINFFSRLCISFDGKIEYTENSYIEEKGEDEYDDDTYIEIRQHILYDEEIKEIIGQIHEGHLRMFLKEKETDELEFYFDSFGNINYNRKNIGECVEVIDNSKPYQEQSEDFFKKLNDFLIKEFNINL